MMFKKYLLFDVEHDNFKLSLINGFEKHNMDTLLQVQQDWTPLGNGLDRLYFFPGCAVPRFKVRENYSCTIKPDNATAAFISANGIKEGSAVNVLHGVAALSIADGDRFIRDNFDKDEKERIRYNMLVDQTQGILVTENLWKQQWYNVLDNCRYPINDCVDSSKYDLKNRRQDFYQVFPDSGIHSLQCPIYFETAVLRHLNQDQVVIDEKRYEEFRAFGLSQDEENVVLMMELMANCDFEKSFVYLLFLLKEFGQKIAPLKAAHHVNFKSLLTFMDLTVKDLDSINLGDLTRALKKHKKFTRTNVQLITSLCAGDQFLGQHRDVSMYTPGQVLSPDSYDLLDD